jgi:phosphatidylglycerol:prolipoprotein diacylglycerol transferase
MLKITTVSFPGIGIGEFNVNSTAFTVFGVSIAWYAIIITLGMAFAVWYTSFRAKKIGISFDEIIDFALFVIPIGVIGARLYYVIMELDRYHSLKDVFNIRNGGLAIYGGIIAGGLTVLVVCFIKKIFFPAFADCVVPGLIMAQSIGRWGNFMNGEAYGYSDNINSFFLRMGLGSGNFVKYVHPTFFYESMWNLIGFIAINIFYKHKKYDGQIFLIIFGWYGLGRMWIEGLRTDSLMFSLFGVSFRVSQILAGFIFAVCTSALIYFAIKPPRKDLYIRQKT